MRFIFTLIIILLSFLSYCQNLTGIWRGTFVNTSKNIDMFGRVITDERVYKYEVQIHNLVSNALEGVTYSYLQKTFYGKASMQGVYMKKNNNIIIKELKLLEVEVKDNSGACPMTCYLEYKKENGKEYLVGTYSSVTEKDASKDCGNGTVTLQKVTTTDFVKEPFLLKPIKPQTTPTIPKTNNTIAKNSNLPKPIFKPGAEGFMVEKKQPQKQIKDTAIVTITPNTVKEIKPEIPKAPIPKVLEQRQNIIAHKLVVDDTKVTIEFVDNGEIDNDSISVYIDEKAVVSKQKLTYKPITIQLEIDPTKGNAEFIVVAENLGIIPPNTAMVTITCGSKKYEVFIEANEQKNAKIILDYKPSTR